MSSRGDHLRPASAAARAATEMSCAMGDRVSRQHRPCIERVGPEACRGLIEVSRESDACEVGGFFRGRRGSLLSPQHRAQAAIRAIAGARLARRASTGSKLGPRARQRR